MSKRITSFGKLFLFVILVFTLSCSEKNPLQGAWVWEKPSDSTIVYLHDGDTVFAEAESHYLFFDGETFTSIEYPGYIVEDGNCTFSGDTLVLNCNGWEESSTIKLDGNKLALTRPVNGVSTSLEYLKNDTLLPRHMTAGHSEYLASYSGYHARFDWVFTGETYVDTGIYSVGNSDELSFPDTLKMFSEAGNFGYAKGLFWLREMNGQWSLYDNCGMIVNYDGKTIHVAQSASWGSGQKKSDLIYIYKRQRPVD